MKITRETPIILFNIDEAHYREGTLKDRTLGEVPVCTKSHFIHAVCKLFQDVTPNIGDNPMFQDIDWHELETNEELQEVES